MNSSFAQIDSLACFVRRRMLGALFLLGNE